MTDAKYELSEKDVLMIENHLKDYPEAINPVILLVNEKLQYHECRKSFSDTHPKRALQAVKTLNKLIPSLNKIKETIKNDLNLRELLPYSVINTNLEMFLFGKSGHHKIFPILSEKIESIETIFIQAKNAAVRSKSSRGRPPEKFKRELVLKLKEIFDKYINKPINFPTSLFNDLGNDILQIIFGETQSYNLADFLKEQSTLKKRS